MEITKIRESAIQEVLNPTFALTKQFLGVNELIYVDGQPKIEDVFFNDIENKASVYFSVKDENFYFVVFINTEEFKPVWIGMSPGILVELLAVSDDNNLDQMLNIIDFKPKRQWEKGEKRRQSTNAVYNNSGFMFSIEDKKTGELEDKVKQLIDFLIQRKESIVTLSDIAKVEISIAYFGYKDQMWGIHLENELIKKMSELNISFDVDLYASGKDLSD